MPASSMVWVILQQVAVLLGALASLLAILGVADRVVGGRIRDRLVRYLRLEDLRGQVDENGEKLDRLHEDHMTTMGAQVAVAQSQQEWTDLFADELDVPEERRPERVTVEELRRRAHERGADFPGQFRRGGGEPDPGG